jgi:Bax protein
MNIQLLSGKLYDYTIIAIFLLLVFLIGTYFPNDSVKDKIRQETIKQIKAIGSFYEPKIDTSSSDKFIDSMKKCIAYINLDLKKEEQIPTLLIIAQSIVESDYGTSRFAKEGNALFGVRVWSKNGILPLKQDPSINWRIKTYHSKCASTKDYINILNNNHHYSNFRNLRKKTKDPIKLAETLENYSTSQTYRIEIIRMINKIKHKI